MENTSRKTEVEDSNSKTNIIIEKGKEEDIKKLFFMIGVPSKLTGYSYLVSAIMFYNENPRQKFSKDIYPKVANKFSTSPKYVERAMNQAIKGAWKNCHKHIIEKEFGIIFEATPTNSQFIFMTHLWLKKKNEE